MRQCPEFRSAVAGTLMLACVLLPALYAGPAGSPAPSPRPSSATQKPDPASLKPPAEAASKADTVVEGTKDADLLQGGSGEDWLFGNEGDDTLLGGPGDDTLDGGEGDDLIDGGDDTDVIDGVEGSDILRGGGGDDVLDGGDGEDHLDGGAGNDDLNGGDDNDTLRAAAGDDTLNGGDGDDTLDGGDGRDRLFGRDGNDALNGGAAEDELEGGDGNDLLAGGAGGDQLEGGDGDDTIRGGGDNDVITGGAGDDILQGEAGDDSVIGGDGQDEVSGGAGNDVVLPGLGHDRVMLAEGDDTIWLRGGDVGNQQNEIVDGGGGNDTLLLNGFAARHVVAGAQKETFTITDPVTGGIYAISGIERILHTHLFSFMTAADDRGMTFAFTNPSQTETAKATIAFFGPDGRALSIPVNGNQAAATASFDIPPFATTEVITAAVGAARFAMAEVRTTIPLAGTVRLAAIPQEPVAIGELRLADGVAVPFARDRARGLTSSIQVFGAIVATPVKFTLFNLQGGEQESREIDVPANGQLLRSFEDLFPAIDRFQGTLSVQGPTASIPGRPVAGIGLHVQPEAGGVAPMPGIPIPQTPSSDQRYHASVMGGAGSDSSLFLFNPSASAAKGELAFFDAGGAPLALPIIGRDPSATVPFELTPGAGLMLTTPSDGPAVIGSARVTMAEGRATSVLRLGLRDRGTVAAGPSSALENFIVPVQRDSAADVTTEIALSSTGTAVDVRLALRDANGGEIPGGQANLSIPANGQVARRLEELFTGVDTARFAGAVVATAKGGTVAAVVIELRGSPATMAIMPLRPLQ